MLLKNSNVHWDRSRAKCCEAGVDLTYANLGRDLVAQFDSFTLDFAQLRFYLRKRMPDLKQRVQTVQRGMWRVPNNVDDRMPFNSESGRLSCHFQNYFA